MAAVFVLLLLVMTTVFGGHLVAVDSGVEVIRGRSASITVEQLQITVDPATDCKVEVVMNEPVTQRVGRLTPQVRPCLLRSQLTWNLLSYWCFVSRCLTAAYWMEK